MSTVQPWSVADRRAVAEQLGLTVPELQSIGQRRALARLAYLQDQLRRAAAAEARARLLNGLRGGGL